MLHICPQASLPCTDDWYVSCALCAVPLGLKLCQAADCGLELTSSRPNLLANLA
jgi:hypothetical protein